jgi:peptidoglycan hydrolase-like protein with peptidoglycan-binding domain
VLAMLAASWACKGKTVEQREREAAEEISRSIRDVEADALAQEVAAEVVKDVQTRLAKIHIDAEGNVHPCPPAKNHCEYQGAVNGKLDSVTVNAIQAFQRSQHLEDSGTIDEQTRARLAAVAP